MRTVRAVKRLSVIEHRFIQNHISRARSTLPRHAAVRMKRSAKPAENAKDRHKDCRQDSIPPDMALRQPDRCVRNPEPEPDEKRHEQDRASQARPKLILLHRCIPDGRMVILPAIEQHDIEALMKDLIIRDADHEKQRHQAHSHTAQDLTDPFFRPPGPDGIRQRTKHKRKRRQKRRRLQANAGPKPERLKDILPAGTSQLAGINQQKCNTKYHEQDVDTQEQLADLLQ